MKSILITVLMSTILLFTNCKKSNDTSYSSPTLNAIRGTWKSTKSICYENPNIAIVSIFGRTYAFNSDMSGSITSNGNGSIIPFIYNLLSDDSTLIIKYGGGIPDTTVITRLTPTDFMFHGKNTYAHATTVCINSNLIDSLYK